MTDHDEFSYTPVTPLAPVSLVLGIAGLVGLLSELGLLVSFFGSVIGLIALIKIKRSAGALGGFVLATLGFLLSTTILFGGSAMHVYNYKTELPPDHLRVNFPREISKRQFVMDSGVREIHPDIKPMLGKKIFIKGWMYQTLKDEGIKQFVLLKDSGECCFGGDPKPYDMMQVTMAPGTTTKSYGSMVAVAGVLQADPSAAPGAPVYFLEATECGLAKSSF